jgi:hypothetical protein
MVVHVTLTPSQEIFINEKQNNGINACWVLRKALDLYIEQSKELSSTKREKKTTVKKDIEKVLEVNNDDINNN